MQSALTEEASREINRILKELLEKVEGEAVFFCDRGGNIISRQWVEACRNEENIAALAAGSFFATLEMARLLGESKFRRLIHQGEQMNIYMEGMAGDLLLIVVFSKDSNPGLVKLYAQNACRLLEQYNFSMDRPSDAKGGKIPEFKLEVDPNAQPFVRSPDRKPS